MKYFFIIILFIITSSSFSSEPQGSLYLKFYDTFEYHPHLSADARQRQIKEKNHIYTFSNGKTISIDHSGALISERKNLSDPGVSEKNTVSSQVHDKIPYYIGSIEQNTYILIKQEALLEIFIRIEGLCYKLITFREEQNPIIHIPWGKEIAAPARPSPSPKIIRPFSCPQEGCAKAFTSKHSLKRHMLIHGDQKTFSCPDCNKQLKISSSIRRHKRIHTKEKPFPCSVCHRCFNDRSNLKRHMTTHGVGRLHYCPLCKRTYTRKESLQRHKCMA